MQTDSLDKEPGSSSPDAEMQDEPICLVRSLTWAFLPPAFMALIYGVSVMLLGMTQGGAAGTAIVFVAILLKTPDKTYLDWSGLCFVTGAVGLFFIGSFIASVFGGLACLFAILTLVDAETGPHLRHKLFLVGTYLFSASLAVAVLLLPSWASLCLVGIYMLGYQSIKLLPLGLWAKASLADDAE